MIRGIDKENKAPAYIQIYNMLKSDIIAGTYLYGSKLPSKRLIAAESGVSVITVMHALTILTEEGYVEARERSGMFVIYRQGDFQISPSASVRQAVIEQAQPQHHSVGEFPFSVAAKTMRKVILDYGDKIFVKPDNLGCIELRRELSSYLARSRGINVPVDRIIIGAGAEYLYGLIAQLLGSSDIIAIEDPSYEKIEKVYNAMGVKCERLKLAPDGIISDELSCSKAKNLHVTPFNSFPSKANATVSKKREYLSWAKQRDGLIIEDNYDSELTVSSKAEETLFSMTEDGNVIYLNTFSKTIAPSIRIGYMLLPEKLQEEFNEKLGFYSCTVPSFDQFVLAELIHNGDYERHVNRVRRQRRRMLQGK